MVTEVGIPPIRIDDAVFLLVMGLVLLVMFRGIKMRAVSIMIIVAVAGYALLPMLYDGKHNLPTWALVLLVLWIGYALVRALAGLLLGREVADHLLANLLTLLVIGPIRALGSMLRKFFQCP